MSDETLNAQNSKALQGFIAANVALFLTELGVAGIPSGAADAIKSWIGPLAPWALIGPIAVVVLLGVVPDWLTESIVFLKRRNRLPSYRAFSKIANNDPLVNVKQLMDHLDKKGDLPREPEEQQYKDWYKLYQEVESKPSVRDTHRRYLLMRDATTLSLLYIPCLWGTFRVFGHPTWRVAFTYLGALLLQLVLTRVAASRYGIRLVRNVLHVASANQALS